MHTDLANVSIPTIRVSFLLLIGILYRNIGNPHDFREVKRITVFSEDRLF